MGAAPVAAAEPNVVVQVEEDWELVLNEPDPTTNSPQVTCVTSPVGHVDGVYAALDLNHHTLSDYFSGGMQLQVWSDDVPLGSVYPPMYNLLQASNEQVTWTQRMRLADGQLSFTIVNGTSSSWGPFGGTEVSVSLTSSLANLNGYDPQVSVQHSGVGFGGNRVNRLALKRVRLYSSSGQVHEVVLNAKIH